MSTDVRCAGAVLHPSNRRNPWFLSRLVSLVACMGAHPRYVERARFLPETFHNSAARRPDPRDPRLSESARFLPKTFHNYGRNSDGRLKIARIQRLRPQNPTKTSHKSRKSGVRSWFLVLRFSACLIPHSSFAIRHFPNAASAAFLKAAPAPLPASSRQPACWIIQTKTRPWAGSIFISVA